MHKLKVQLILSRPYLLFPTPQSIMSVTFRQEGDISMNQSPLSPPRPGSSPIVTPEGIICGTDGKYRWVSQCIFPFRACRHCTLFTMDERSISSRQSQPALRFQPPKELALTAVRRILVCPRKNRIILRRGLCGLALQTDAAQLEISLDYLSPRCPQAAITRYD